MNDEYTIRRNLSFDSYNPQAEKLLQNKNIIPYYLNSGFVPTALRDFKQVDAFEQEYKEYCNPYIHLFNYLSPTDKNVLEVGCGFGRGCNFIKNMYNPRSIVGCDINDSILAVASHHFPKINFYNADAVSLQTLNSLFDIVVTIETLLYWDCHHQSFNSISSVIKDGGSFLMASDMRRTDTTLDKRFHDVGLKLVDERDITVNVLLSLYRFTDNTVARAIDDKKIKMFTTKYKCVSKHYTKQ